MSFKEFLYRRRLYTALRFRNYRKYRVRYVEGGGGCGCIQQKKFWTKTAADRFATEVRFGSYPYSPNVSVYRVP